MDSAPTVRRPLAFRHQMGWRNANQRHTSRLTGALHFAAILSHLERNIAGLERLVSDLIEISTRHHFALWQARGEIFGGWARSVSGSTAQDIGRIEDGVRDYRATGSMLRMPCYLALKAEALHLANRISEALEVINEAEAVVEDLKSAAGLPNCTGCAVCFSRLWVLTRPKLTPRFVKLSELHRSRSRFPWRNAQKRPTRSTAVKKRARQEDVDSDSLFDVFLERAAFRSAYALDRIQHSREQTFVFERREGLYGEPDKDLPSY
jgi:hypothetical protein